MGPPKYPEMAHHPIQKIPPARPFYRFMATGLGASMWFFVRMPLLCAVPLLTLPCPADVPREEGRPRSDGLEAPVGPLRKARPYMYEPSRKESLGHGGMAWKGRSGTGQGQHYPDGLFAIETPNIFSQPPLSSPFYRACTVTDMRPQLDRGVYFQALSPSPCDTILVRARCQVRTLPSLACPLICRRPSWLLTSLSLSPRIRPWPGNTYLFCPLPPPATLSSPLLHLNYHSGTRLNQNLQ